MSNKQKILVSFSGGRTSAYMCWWLKENKSDIYDFTFVYANTGQEHHKTLEFVNNCDLFFKLDLIWIEALVNNEDGVGTTYDIVNYESASKNGKPYEEVIKKYGLPNINTPICNRELKTQPINAFMRDNNIKLRAIGIRNDEFKRAVASVTKKHPKLTTLELLEYKFKNDGFYYPLIKDRPTTKDEIRFWWSKMPFDLEITEEYGNCVWCWKKSERKLKTIAKNNPQYFDFPKKMEEKYGHYIPKNQNRDFRNVLFRNYLSTEDILHKSRNDDFIEFKEGKEFQLSLFNEEIDEDFSCNECGTI